MIHLIKKLLFKVLSQSAYLSALHKGFYLLFDLGMLKRDKRFKFHYAVKSLIKNDFTVVDIGANLGYFAKNFARLSPKGKVICIEPIAPFYAILQKFLRPFPQVKLHHLALGLENGEIDMVLPESNGVIRTGLPHVIGENEDASTQKTTKVAIRKGSELLADLSTIDYIKCDIEGYEWLVFNEIKEIIAKHRPMIQVEISEKHIASFVSYFDELNYCQYGICDFKFIAERGIQKEIGDFLFIPNEQKETFEKTHNIQ